MSALSIFDIFKIGIGPSSSHTMGPMKAASEFARLLVTAGTEVAKINVTLYGSLAFTGKGHATDSAILLGLEGSVPETIDPDSTEPRLRGIHRNKTIDVPGVGILPFDPDADILFELQRSTNLCPRCRCPRANRAGLCS